MCPLPMETAYKLDNQTPVDEGALGLVPRLSIA